MNIREEFLNRAPILQTHNHRIENLSANFEISVYTYHIRECSLCRMEGHSSDTNTKIYIFSFFSFFFFLGVSKARDNIKAAMNKQIR